MPAGRFREDLYYRLCSDLIVTPSLEEQLREAPGERAALVRFIAAAGGRRGRGREPGRRRRERWIDAHLGPGYRWPGNVRELEQCVRNVLIRGEYRPPRAGDPSARRRVADDVLAGALSADELLRRYCTLVYARHRQLPGDRTPARPRPPHRAREDRRPSARRAARREPVRLRPDQR